MVFLFDEVLFKDGIPEKYDYLKLAPIVQCNASRTIDSTGIWVANQNILLSAFPRFLIQAILLFAGARASQFVFKPLGMPSHLSYVMGGIMLGPNMLGALNPDRDPLQPFSGNYGLIFSSANSRVLYMLSVTAEAIFSVLMGAKTDLGMIKRAGKNAATIAIVGMVVPLTFAITSTYSLNEKYLFLRAVGLRVGFPFSNTAFIVLATQLKEHDMLTSKLGRLAISGAIVISFSSAIFSFCYFIFLRFVNSNLGFLVLPQTVGALLASMSVIYFLTKYVSQQIIKRTTPGKDVSKSSLLVILMLTVLAVLLSDVVGVSSNVLPLLLGLLLPSGPPIGSTLVRRLDGIISCVFIPVSLANIGSKTDLFTMIDLYTMLIPTFLFVMVCFALKIAAVSAACLFFKMPLRDSFLVSLMMSSKGITDMTLYQASYEVKNFRQDLYTAMVYLTLVLGWLVASIIKWTYQPSLRYQSYHRRTVQRIKPRDFFRTIACVHTLDHAVQLSRLLDASCPTADNPMHAYVLHLVPLVDRAAAVIAPLWREGLPKPPESNRIAAIFMLVERKHERNILAFPYLSMAPRATMYDDICSMALDKKAALILLPFHGNNTVYQNTYLQVLTFAPCSVGIFIDYCYEGDSNALQNVGVIFFGGSDDRECLALAKRIAGSSRASITVIRFMIDEQNTVPDGRDSYFDDEALKEYKELAAGNICMSYREQEEVASVPDMVRTLREIAEEFGLLIVGRREGKKSQLTKALEEWSEYPELGALGDMLASEDFKGKVSTLVLQQQALVAGRRMNR